MLPRIKIIRYYIVAQIYQNKKFRCADVFLFRLDDLNVRRLVDGCKLMGFEMKFGGKQYDEKSIDRIVEIPYSEGKRFEIEVNNDYKTSQGIRVPLFEARAPFESYLSDLNEQELVNLIDRETKLEHYAGLKVGDIYAPNNNAGNWE